MLESWLTISPLAVNLVIALPKSPMSSCFDPNRFQNFRLNFHLMKDYRCLSRRHRTRSNCQKYLRIPLDILLIRSLSSYDRLRTNSEASLGYMMSLQVTTQNQSQNQGNCLESVIFLIS